MKHLKSNMWPIISSIVHITIISICSIVFIKNFYILFGVGNDMYYIFEQLKSAKIIVPFIIPLLVFFFIYKFLFKISFKTKKALKIILFIVLLYFISIVTYILSIVFAIVNDVVFIDIIISLIKNMEGLGL